MHRTAFKLKVIFCFALFLPVLVKAGDAPADTQAFDFKLPLGISRDLWTYFIPKDLAFSASHGLLGSVLREGDTVGLRIGASGEREWFVNNSVYNGTTTIWTRRVKDKDPGVTAVVGGYEANGRVAERLFYLGTEGNQIRVRREYISLIGLERDNFLFPMDAKGKGAGAVNGAEFTLVATPQHALFTITEPMNN